MGTDDPARDGVGEGAGVTELVIYNDSRSPVNHVNGHYKVKQEHLIPIVEKTWEMRAEFSSLEICWTRRENTKEADALCRTVDKPRIHCAEAARNPRFPSTGSLEEE
jgi:reverse transcriptase-like protein